jgi:choline dehydrogenase-like flavoprotein
MAHVVSHVAFTEGRHAAFEADYAVVGSGAGGASAALTLARAGHRVALVEAGAWRDPEHYPLSTWAVFRDLMPETGAGVVAGRAAWPIVQGTGVGGSTVINSAICVRTPDDVFDEWQDACGLDAASLRRRLGDAQDALMHELGATPSPRAVQGRLNTLALDASPRAGYPSEATERFVRDCAGSGRCLQGCRARRKQSMNETFIPEVRARGGLVLSCAPVDRVDLAAGRAVSVSGRFRHPVDRRRGARFTVRARRGVVVAASATRTASLLAASGLRHSRLGHGFRAHPGTSVLGWYDDPVDMHRGVTQGWASLAFRSSHRLKLESLALPFELIASRLPGGGAALTERIGSIRNLALWVLAVRAHAVGRVGRLLGVPWIRYEATPQDMVAMREGLGILARTHFAAGARWVLPNVAGLPWRIGPGDIGLLDEASLDPRAWVAILSHLFGGATMGRHDDTVCDEDGRVRGVAGLFVADASILPGTLGVNPQLTILSMARICAERWAADRAPAE